MPLPVVTEILPPRSRVDCGDREQPERSDGRLPAQGRSASEIATRSDHQFKKPRKPVCPVNVEHQKALSTLDRLAVWTTERVGTMGFCLLLLAWTVVWLGWNTLAPNGLRFDPYPAFVLWLFLSNLIQICLMPLIMVGQNLQGRHAEARAEADFDVNTKAEREIEAILGHLEGQGDMILRILNQLEGTSKP
jgi:uncharacterized membrane protein